MRPTRNRLPRQEAAFGDRYGQFAKVVVDGRVTAGELDSQEQVVDLLRT